MFSILILSYIKLLFLTAIKAYTFVCNVLSKKHKYNNNNAIKRSDMQDWNKLTFFHLHFFLNLPHLHNCSFPRRKFLFTINIDMLMKSLIIIYYSSLHHYVKKAARICVPCYRMLQRFLISGLFLLHVLSIQQSSVLGDLQLQPGFNVQQNLVFWGLPLNVRSHSTELFLQAVHYALVVAQLLAETCLCLIQLTFQGSFLHRRPKKTKLTLWLSEG